MEKLTEDQRKKRQQENEAKKEYLQSYKKYKQKAKRLEEQLEELRLGKMFPSMGRVQGNRRTGRMLAE